MNIAVFGDLHGKVLLPFYLVSRWQQAHGKKISYALCTGDVGVYRGFETMEKTSQRFAGKHPEELGFSKFLLKRAPGNGRLICLPEVEMLVKEAGVSLYFVPGNHEEHQFLGDIWYNYASSLLKPVAVDYDWDGVNKGLYSDGDFRGYGKLLVLPEGPVLNFDGQFNMKTLAPENSVTLRAINGLSNYTMPDAWRSRHAGVDILLTHETYKGRLRGLHPTGLLDRAGSLELFEFIKKIGPSYHFFGHYHWYYPEVEIRNDHGTVTRSVGMNEVNFDRQTSNILPGCFGIINVEGQDEITFEIVQDNWFHNLRFQDCTSFL